MACAAVRPRNRKTAKRWPGIRQLSPYTTQRVNTSVFMMAALDNELILVQRAEQSSPLMAIRGGRDGWYTCRASPSQ
jgi:hypothetical protein